MLRLEKTPKEYLLFIDPFEKDRAKRIKGRRWDAKRKCWVYPKTRLSYNALMTEFGKQLGANNCIRRQELGGDTSDKHVGDEICRFKDENKRLKAQVKDLQDTLRAVMKDKQVTEKQVGSLQEDLASRDEKLLSFRELFQKAKYVVDTVEEDKKKAKAKETTLKAKNKELRAKIKEMKSNEVDLEKYFETRLLDIARETAENDPKFSAVIERVGLAKSLPIEIGKRLQYELQSLCNNGSRDFCHLITEARQAEMLSKDGVDLAHTIRKQRNIAAHELETGRARGLLSLFAASLLWPELTRNAVKS